MKIAEEVGFTEVTLHRYKMYPEAEKKLTKEFCQEFIAADP
jgi:hypothetical protein